MAIVCFGSKLGRKKKSILLTGNCGCVHSKSTTMDGPCNMDPSRGKYQTCSKSLEISFKHLLGLLYKGDHCHLTSKADRT